MLIHDKKHVGIKIKFYNLDTFKKQVDANCIDLDGEFVDLNYNFVPLIFCHLWLKHCFVVVILVVRRGFICRL